MKYRVLDSNGDYCFGKSMQDFLTGTEAVAQAIKTNLKLLQNEWWEDMSNGLPLFQHILGQSGTQDRLNATDLLIKSRILSTTGVAEIQSFQSSYEDRKYTVSSCTVLTNTGQSVTVSEVVF